MADQNHLKPYDQGFYGHPKPLRGLFFTELWERFSFYGILPILALYMSATISQGGLGLDRATAAAIVGLFAGAVYLLPILGGWIADNWLGQTRSVWYGSIIIALGHLSIALTAVFSSFFFYLGLIFIVLGSALFKTCISVMVGTLYSDKDTRRDAGFSIFYMGINIGGFIAPLITGLLIENNGWHLGFGIGGIGMLIALVIFRVIAIPQIQTFDHLRQIKSTWNNPIRYNTKAPKVVLIFLLFLTLIIALTTLNIIVIDPIILVTYVSILVCLILILYFSYLILSLKTNTKEKKQLVVCFVLLIASALFWAAFDQQPIAFNFFIQDYTDRNIMGFEVPVLWFQSMNSIFIINFYYYMCTNFCLVMD